MRVPWLATVLLLFRLALASTITIDDQNGDSMGNKIIYNPQDAWGNNSIGGCEQSEHCSALPNIVPSIVPSIAKTFTGSYFSHTHSSSPPTATVSFTGVSVSVFCIVSSSLPESNMTFSIDGQEHPGEYPSTGRDFEPRSVFHSPTLSPTNHTLVITNGVAGGPSSLVILDYVMYSTGDFDSPSQASIPTLTNSSATLVPVVPPSSSASSVSPMSLSAAKKSNTAAIAGGVIAALAVLLLLLLAFLYIRHRRNQHRSNVPLSATLLSPFSGFCGFWSARESKPPPDIVPFPTPAYPVSKPPASTPRPRRPAPAAPSSGSLSRISRISFNPNRLVAFGRMRRQPASRVPAEPPNPRAASASPVPPPSANPLLRHISAQSDAPDRVATIQEWQRRVEETAGQQPVVHPLEMSEVDLSSHYDESSVSSPAPLPPPPVAILSRLPQPQPQRRFTVMNN